MGANGIYGLSGSGLDIESLVKVGMMSKQNQLNKMQQTETTNMWLKDEWSTIYSKYNDFQSAMSTFKMQSSMSAMKANSANGSVVTATANGAAAAMTHQVTVSQLATNAYVMTDNGATIDKKGNETSNSLKDVLFSKYSLKSTEKDAQGNKINTYDVEGKEVKGSDTAISMTFTDGENTSTIKYTYDDLFEKDKTLYDLATAIGGSGVELQGNFDSVNNTFSIYAKNSGSKNIIGMTANNDTSAALLNSLHLASYDGNTGELNKLDDFAVSSSNLSSSAASAKDVNSVDMFGYKVREMTAAEVKAYNDAIDADGTALVNKLDPSKTYYGTFDDTDTIKGAYLGTDTAIHFNVGDGAKNAEISYSYKDLAEGKATLSDMADKINAAMTYKKGDESYQLLTANFDSATNSLSMTNTEGAVSIKVRNGQTATLLNNLGVKDGSGKDMSFKDGATVSTFTNSVAGTDAYVKVDGKDYVLDNNSKTIAGVTYTFTGESDYVLGSDGKTKIYKSSGVTISQDTDTIVKNVKDFVDSYNELLDYMNGKLSEEKYKDYKPLTKTQEDQMTETQVQKWTEKAKSGLLYHNSTLSSMVSKMREAIYTPIDSINSAYNSASAIGITTSNVKGHLTLDEDKLKQALAADSDCVYKIFASDQDSSYVAGQSAKKPITNSQKKLDYQNTGLANRLYNAMTDFKKNVEDYAGTSNESNDQSYLGKLLTNLQTKMSTFKTQMNAFESMLYKKYDAMESALQGFGVQLNYITGYGN